MQHKNQMTNYIGQHPPEMAVKYAHNNHKVIINTSERIIKVKYGVLRKLKHIFPNTYQRIKSICSPAKGGTGCYRFNYQPGS